MTTISIIYFSGFGNTAKFAESIRKGASAIPDTMVKLIYIEGKDINLGRYQNDTVMNQLDESDAIIFGTPTYMAGVAAQFKAFADATVGVWAQQKWKNKLAAGFTVSGTPSGDKLSALQYLQALAMQHGMIWVGTGEMPAQANGINRLGSWLGAMAQSVDDKNSPITTDDQRSGQAFGRRIAHVAVSLTNAIK